MNDIFAEKARLWQYFHDTGEILPEVRPIIAASWKRCRDLGISLEAADARVLSEGEFADLTDKNQALIHFSRLCLTDVYDMVEDNNNMISVHDLSGCMLYCTSTEAYREQIKNDSNFSLGVQWEEPTIGTNGVSLCMIEDRPVQVYGAEHYCANQHGSTCSAAPIHDAGGHIIGCINMVGRNSVSNAHALGMIAATARAIENLTALHASYSLIDNTFSMIFEGLLVLNGELKIERASRRVSEMLGMDAHSLIGRDLSAIAPSVSFRERVLRERAPFRDMEQDFIAYGRNLSCSVAVTPIMVKGVMTGAVLLLQESREVNRLAAEVAGNRARYDFASIQTRDPEMRRIMHTMQDIASADATVLITGESGTGKELFAHAIHRHGNRANAPFIAVNCASLPHSLVESELFGYERGAFTGAVNAGNPGKFELANGGSIFLDEIGELPLEIQAKLLRILDTRRVMRIGGKAEKELDVRVIAATNRDLQQEVDNYRFRGDLFYRINVLAFHIPPLRQRKDDIPLLAEYFVGELNRTASGGMPAKRVTPECMACLERYDWPGNVRELQNAVLRAFYCSGGEADIGVEHLPAAITTVTAENQPPAGTLETNAAPSDDEARDLQRLLEESDYDIPAAAARLGVSISTLYRRLDRHGINLKEGRRKQKSIRKI